MDDKQYFNGMLNAQNAERFGFCSKNIILLNKKLINSFSMRCSSCRTRQKLEGYLLFFLKG